MGEKGGLQPENIHIHVLRLDTAHRQEPPKELTAFLPKEEIEQCGRFALGNQRREFIWSRLLVRGVLASHLGKGPQDLRFGRGEKGKPFLENGESQFNLSHTEGFIACSVGTRRVGIDVENMEARLRAGADWNLVARRFLSAMEQDYLFSQGLETRAQVFFRIFTMKEARVKAEDKGFGIPLNSFSIPLPPGEISTLEGWEYFTRNTPPGNVFLAHAVENQLEKPLEYNVREWNVESFKGFWAGCFPACNQR